MIHIKLFKLSISYIEKLLGQEEERGPGGRGDPYFHRELSRENYSIFQKKNEKWMRFFSCIACKRRKSKQVKDVLEGFYRDPCVVEPFEFQYHTKNVYT